MANTLPLWLARLVAGLLALVLTGAAWSQDDPPGRVGRVAELQGGVLWFDHERGQWVEAERNRPVTTGDRLSTAPEGRVELRVGSTVLRLGGASELEVLRLDDERLSFQLHSGHLALRVRSREVAGEIDIVTAEARLQPQRSGHYRFDRVDDTTQAGSWRGDLVLEGTAGFVIATGQRAELWRQGPRGELRQNWNALPDDEFSRWVARDDGRDERTASTRYVSPEMTGAEDLDRAGRWDRHPDHGAIWFPIEVRTGWAPYRYGRWAWVRPWGWTWVDEAPWGFAPFHYGRWLSWNGRWGWVPGVIVPRPVFAPALVAWVGGSHWGVSINIRGPVVGWVPLAPREVFVPSYRHTPRHRDRINDVPYGAVHGPHRPHWVPGPQGYGNQAVPGAVTVVPRDALDRRAGIGREAADLRERQRGVDGFSGPLNSIAPPPGPQAVQSPPQGVPTGPQRPPQVREGRDARDSRDGRDGREARELRVGPSAAMPAPVPQPARVPTQEAPPSQGDVTQGPQRPRTDWPAPTEPRRERVDRADRAIDRSERTDRTDRTGGSDRVERQERVDRAGPAAPAWRAPPAGPMMVPQAAPVAAPPQPQPAPQAMGPARPAAPPAVAPAAAPPRPAPGEREKGRERDAGGGGGGGGGDGDRRRGNHTGRESEAQR